MATQALWNRFVAATNAKEGEVYELRKKISPSDGIVCVGKLVSKKDVRSVAFEDRPYITHCVGTVQMEVNGEVRVIDMTLHEFYLPPRDEPVHGSASVLPDDLH